MHSSRIQRETMGGVVSEPPEREPDPEPAGSARLELVEGVALLHPEDAVLEAMLRGWERQQRGGRRLQPKTISARAGCVRQFVEFADEYPWNWTAAHVDEWMTHLISALGRAESTIRTYQGTLRQFCDYLTDPRSEEHTSELQSLAYLVCRLLLEKKKK